MALGTSIAFTYAPLVGKYGHVGILPLWTITHFAPHALYIRGLVQAVEEACSTMQERIYFSYHKSYSSVSYTFI